MILRSPTVRWQTVEDFIHSAHSGKIPPALRMILTSDGLLTTALQSLFLGAVDVEILRQEKSVLDEEPAGFLRLEPGISSHVREVWLSSRGKKIVFARSVIPLDGFSRGLLRTLSEKPIPLGLLLQETGHPTIKDRMEVCRIEDQRPQGIPDSPFFSRGEPLWARRYRLNHGDKNGVYIEEIFSENAFRGDWAQGNMTTP